MLSSSAGDDSGRRIAHARCSRENAGQTDDGRATTGGGIAGTGDAVGACGDDMRCRNSVCVLNVESQFNDASQTQPRI